MGTKGGKEGSILAIVTSSDKLGALPSPKMLTAVTWSEHVAPFGRPSTVALVLLLCTDKDPCVPQSTDTLYTDAAANDAR